MLDCIHTFVAAACGASFRLAYLLCLSSSTSIDMDESDGNMRRTIFTGDAGLFALILRQECENAYTVNWVRGFGRR